MPDGGAAAGGDDVGRGEDEAVLDGEAEATAGTDGVGCHCRALAGPGGWTEGLPGAILLAAILLAARRARRSLRAR
ncbi:MAG: hypothetical protein FJ125_12655 [Deltaproteobacteria bacterium]|nr:hypothetical protein [Deltaproteobacteria bacterium]